MWWARSQRSRFIRIRWPRRPELHVGLNMSRCTTHHNDQQILADQWGWYKHSCDQCGRVMWIFTSCHQLSRRGVGARVSPSSACYGFDSCCFRDGRRLVVTHESKKKPLSVSLVCMVCVCALSPITATRSFSLCVATLTQNIYKKKDNQLEAVASFATCGAESGTPPNLGYAWSCQDVTVLGVSVVLTDSLERELDTDQRIFFVPAYSSITVKTKRERDRERERESERHNPIPKRRIEKEKVSAFLTTNDDENKNNNNNKKTGRTYECTVTVSTDQVVSETASFQVSASPLIASIASASALQHFIGNELSLDARFFFERERERGRLRDTGRAHKWERWWCGRRAVPKDYEHT